METVENFTSKVGSIDKDKVSPRLTLCQMFLLNSVVCGIEICACAGFTYIPPLLLKSGFSEENMSLVLGFGPLLALLFAPTIGQASDRCNSLYGRRRPYILALSTVLIISLYLIPFGESLVIFFIGKSELSKHLGILILIFGSVMLDFSSQTCLTPCEALLNDASKLTGQQERIFSIYSLMVSLGGILGYLLSGINWKSNNVGQYFGGEEASVFSILIFIFTIMLIITLTVAAEKPLSRNSTPESSENYKNIDSLQNSKIPLSLESGYESSSSSRSASEENVCEILVLKDDDISVSYPKTIKPILHRCPQYFNVKRNIYQRLCAVKKFSGFYLRKCIPNTIQQLYSVPLVLKQLAYANFCSWTAVMGFNLYFTDFVGQIVYKGNPNAPPDSESGNLYDEGVRMGSWGLLLHCITSAGYSFFVERLVDKYGSKLTYKMGMTSFCFAMTGMVLVPNVLVVNLMAAMTGFAFATLTTIPFILVSRYHEDKEIFFFDVTSTPMADNGIGMCIATLDSAYFLSQVLLTSCAGYIVHITGTVLTYMVTAGIMGVFSIIFINRIIVTKQDLLQLINERRNVLYL